MGSRQRSSQASLLSLRKEAFGQPADVTDVEALTSAKLVVIGEIHNTPACIQLQCRTASGLLGSLPHDEAKLHIVLEQYPPGNATSANSDITSLSDSIEPQQAGLM